MLGLFLAVMVGCTGSDEPKDAGSTEPSTTDSPTDSPTDSGTDTTDTPTDTGEPEGFCAVQALFGPNCLQCHSADAAFGDLDLQTDPHAALVDVVGSTGALLVDPGDPDGSFLLRKLEGTQGAGEGDPMPPTELLDSADVQLVRDWILAGATPDCSDPNTTEPEPYHPEDYDDPAVHGPDFKLQAEVCTDCHDAELTFCESCHGAEWQTDCTFCHGDPATGVAAPPRDIDGNTDPATISFPEHTVHVLGDEDEPLHIGWACSECHLEPSDIFSLGHVQSGDTTIGVAELTFGLRSPDAVYTPGIGCSNVWCHGSGQDGGEGSIDLGTDLVCGGCHGVATHWRDMSGRHRGHLVDGLGCEECHATAASDPYRIVDFDLHINGVRDVAMPPGMTFSAGACTGECHNEQHNATTW